MMMLSMSEHIRVLRAIPYRS